ncbi:BCCT family transporter [Oceanimonas baumannii]|uniref:BCCT transporter n=1 Tax=Oceanimonas baumannii TaxID=129578 RepID=A0A235CGR3_9GAMM|nr:BCCT family transporter [Oceanimonas baumannii]OYD23574.1 BCCT transporter [Oceanimonas baumannii]TDW56889.1 choline-glycine betaine transporter [Oceanimonas baumannii]
MNVSNLSFTEQRLVAGLSGGFLLLFVILAFFDLPQMTQWINQGFAWTVDVFGPLWQVWMLANLVIALVLGLTRYGDIRLGGNVAPDSSTFRWLAVIMCTLLAGGGVFWSAAEPMYHYVTTPPLFADSESGVSAVSAALAQSFMHWGFLAWAALGTLSAIVVVYAHYHKGLAMRPRTLLYPLLGEKVESHWLGTLADVVSIIAVAAGTIGPIGFLATQLGFSFEALLGWENNYGLQLAILGGLVLIYTLSASTGIEKGIQWLSSANVVLAVILLGIILLAGPGNFIIDSFLNGMGTYLQDFMPMALNRQDDAWLGWWTLFFWGWFIGYGPMMALFIARISRGRSLRELVMAVAVMAPLVTNFWFASIGGAGIFYEQAAAGVVSAPLQESGLPAALLAVTQQLPLAELMVPAFLILTVIFVATTGDSMAYSISMAISGDHTPRTRQRIFWALTMGLVAAVLLRMGEGGINALQSFIVITAAPVSLLLLPVLWTGPRMAHAMAYEQGIVTQAPRSKVAASKSTT